jgi:hypothetical protein
VTLATLTWPEASVYVALILSIGAVVTVLVWSIFRTGQTAIRYEKPKRTDTTQFPS